jgi:hypothetical protein
VCNAMQRIRATHGRDMVLTEVHGNILHHILA